MPTIRPGNDSLPVYKILFLFDPRGSAIFQLPSLAPPWWCFGFRLYSGGRQAWWYTPVTLTLGRLRQEDQKLEASLVFIVREEIYLDIARIMLLFPSTKGSDECFNIIYQTVYFDF